MLLYPTSAPLAVIFDWYNTLINTSNINYNIASQALHMMGYNVSLDTIPNTQIRQYLTYLLNNKLKEWSILYEQILNKSQIEHKIQLNENVLEMLELLHQKSISMAIVSNKNGYYLRRDVYDLNLTKYFKSIIGANDTPENKPSPKPILAALEILNLPPTKKIFVIGDSISDVESAKNANCLPIMYNHNTNINGVLSFTHFKELSNLIINLSR
ncbi:HAD-IA family hydrolase [Neoehrlichia mikurensis]|uniref:HAD family hydrolase n=1 Tax=Neoehrlichia mikurensis TaxID=89586 RepID=A0A9Q9BXW9_9RICK|nr:HAD-IA family hydrolase [Neoehrlichia mikurensis]QXK91737.1 HAD-IA family hydrolase [Neoehrlichia mikurensis]QXK92949.1 HAD-IA family hydrolase [Neoehrlichia mikurensis]QXK93427.1 HAD-IA family hydrolase [Neoehrlichia mikurensis]UTO55621.1 HAD family hydrolase [Neoehrlichia mikurensis]UTO56542.1 HAD family hydrolase [Neoehrlichia mikurensis]